MLLAAVGLAAYALSGAVGQEPPMGQPGDPDAVATLKADSAKPKLAGTIAGVRLTGGLDNGPLTECPEVFSFLPADVAVGTPFEIRPGYLPAGIAGESSPPTATTCRGEVIGSKRIWTSSQSGSPWIWIERVLRPEPWSAAAAPADRVSSGTVSTQAAKNIPAVLIKPVLPDGRGGPVIIFSQKIDRGFVVTEVGGENVTLDELRKVVEGMTR
jgi:hypothetical protein